MHERMESRVAGQHLARHPQSLRINCNSANKRISDALFESVDLWKAAGGI
jgi:hypothetical protein